MELKANKRLSRLDRLVLEAFRSGWDVDIVRKARLMATAYPILVTYKNNS